MAVCAGTRDSFEMVYRCDENPEERWWVMSVNPLRRPDGGAVISHLAVTREKVAVLARLAGDDRFHQLVDDIPVPMWIVGPKGHLAYANRAWKDVTDQGVQTISTLRWTDAAHPDDRRMADAMFLAAVSRGESFALELRLKGADGGYRWWACKGAPRWTVEGRVEGYVGVCYDITTHQRARAKLADLASKLVAAQETERSRIARELHDDVGQEIALLSAKLEAIAPRGTTAIQKVRASLAEVRSRTQVIAEKVHLLSHKLHPGRVKLLGLERTLEILCREVSAETGVAIDFRTDGMSYPVAEDTAMCLFRVTQEAVQNCIKHSGAQIIIVEVVSTSSDITLRVTDNGRGFSTLASQWAGLGLLTMRERVELLGGMLRIESEEARGTTIEATVPLALRPARMRRGPGAHAGSHAHPN
jgi:PAS domain S-box-containing protein